MFRQSDRLADATSVNVPWAVPLRFNAEFHPGARRVAYPG